MLEIKLLNNCADFAPVLARWAYDQWYGKRNIDCTIIIKEYRKRADDLVMPLTWVAIENAMPIGMGTLKENDLWSRKDLNPWLASLYILPDFRNQGIAGKLIEKVLGKAREMEFKEIYLFLGRNSGINLVEFYKKRGWHYLGDSIDNYGMPTKIFYFLLK